MSVKAIGMVMNFNAQDPDENEDENPYTVEVKIACGIQRDTIYPGPFSPSASASTTNTAIEAAVKAFCEGRGWATFGLGDTVQLITGVQLP